MSGGLLTHKLCALGCRPTVVLAWLQVTLEGNTGRFGGAIDIYGGTLELSGSVACNFNQATYSGGCMYSGRRGTAVVNGPLCAVNNRATNGGSLFHVSFSSTLHINNTFLVTVVDERLKPAVRLEGLRSSLTCGASQTWVYRGSAGDLYHPGYAISGSLCACNDAFVAGTSETCDTCDGLGQASPKCSCVSSSCSAWCSVAAQHHI